jgi:oxygen-dependent protoporphyrinogen oxidase
MDPIIIVGAGIAGLATAFELQRRGIRFVVLEASGRAGGVILSEQIDGYTIDGGPDALLVQKPDGIALCRELGLGDRLIPTKPPRLAFIQRGGILHPLPASSVLGIPTRIGPFVRTRLFSWPAKLRMGAEVFVRPRQDACDESIGAFMTRHFGAEATTYLAEPLLAGIHAGDVDRLSVQSLFPRFTAAEHTHGSLLRAFRSQPRGQASPDGAFRSLPGGLSEMVRALVAALPTTAIRLNTPVARVAITRGTNLVNPVNPVNPVSLHIETSAGERLDASAVVLATPAYVTARIVRNADEELSRLCNEVPYASTATIAMAFPRAAVRHPLNGSGFVVPRAENTGILAASWLSSKWAHRAPEDRVLMRVFAGGARDPKALERSDAELIAHAVAAIRPLLGIAGAPLLTRVYRWDRASAQHEVGHLARMQAIDRALERHPGLFVTGSGFRGVGIPDCVADGRATAARIATLLTAAT